MRATKEVSADSFEQKEEHTLFVEGSGNNPIDRIIGKLLENKILVKALGSSSNIRAVARALHKYHPKYYFLVDRDHYDDDEVENYWSNFPNPEKSNLLMWRMKELENYFLDAEYLRKCKSDFISVLVDELSQKILDCCKKRLYLDTVNLVIISIREEQKNTWIEIFRKQDEFKSKDEAISKLKEHTKFAKRKESVYETLNPPYIENKFENVLTKMTGGKKSIEYGCGEWIKLIKGKDILKEVLNSECFKVKNKDGIFLQGDEKNWEILKELIKKPLNEQPEDFQRLHKLINRKILNV